MHQYYYHSLGSEAKQILQNSNTHIQCHTNVHALQYLNYMNALLHHEPNVLQCIAMLLLLKARTHNVHILLVIIIISCDDHTYISDDIIFISCVC